EGTSDGISRRRQERDPGPDLFEPRADCLERGKTSRPQGSESRRYGQLAEPRLLESLRSREDPAPARPRYAPYVREFALEQWRKPEIRQCATRPRLDSHDGRCLWASRNRIQPCRDGPPSDASHHSTNPVRKRLAVASSGKQIRKAVFRRPNL